MDRDEVAALLALPLAGISLWLVARGLRSSSPADERGAWRRLWLPIAPAVLVCAVLAGWASADPEGPQDLGATRVALAIPFALVLVRGIVRAVRGLRSGRGEPARTVGVLRPSVEIDEAFAKTLSAIELEAVALHEHAHARRRDPLRIWLARIATDLQWPVAGERAEARFTEWVRAMELTCDAEAVRRGADPTALATAILQALDRRRPYAPTSAAAALASDAEFLERRVRTLLAHEPTLEPGRTGRCLAAAIGVVIACAFAFGATFGERFVPYLAR